MVEIGEGLRSLLRFRTPKIFALYLYREGRLEISVKFRLQMSWWTQPGSNNTEASALVVWREEGLQTREGKFDVYIPEMRKGYEKWGVETTLDIPHCWFNCSRRYATSSPGECSGKSYSMKWRGTCTPLLLKYQNQILNLKSPKNTTLCLSPQLQTVTLQAFKANTPSHYSAYKTPSAPGPL